MNGNSSPFGGSNFTTSPFSLIKVSVIGLKVRSPAMARAVTNSGLATNAKVFGLPSARFAKFLLKECTIVFLSCFSAPILSHIPIHGPHAFAKTVAPICANISKKPSLSMVYLTSSLPGVMVNSAFVFKPFSATCFARLAARLISSYEELVQLPINPTSTFVGQLFFAAASFI